MNPPEILAVESGDTLAKRPTVYDVAALAGVSIATVSFAFTRPEKLKAQTLATVLSAAGAIGYVPSANARGLARGRTGALGLYAFDYLLEPDSTLNGTAPARVDDLPDGRLFPLYSDEVQRGVQLECRARGYALMLGSGQDSGHLSNVIDVAGRVDGLIAFAGAATDSSLKQVSTRIPVVELGGEVRREGMHTIFVDNRIAMTDLTRHLLDVHGHRSFVYVGERSTAEFVARFEGFADALVERGIKPPELTRSHPGQDGPTVEAVSRYLSKANMPDVFVCATDQEALVVIDTVRAAGFAVPADVAVTGFDGILAGQLAHPLLTTVRQPMEEIGRAAVQMLVELIDGNGDADRHEVLLSRVRIGHSCGC